MNNWTENPEHLLTIRLSDRLVSLCDRQGILILKSYDHAPRARPCAGCFHEIAHMIEALTRSLERMLPRRGN